MLPMPVLKELRLEGENVIPNHAYKNDNNDPIMSDMISYHGQEWFSTAGLHWILTKITLEVPVLPLVGMTIYLEG